MDEEYKKLVIERAAVAGQQSRQGRAGARPSARNLLEGLVDTARTSGGSGNPVMDQLLFGQGRSPFGLPTPQTPDANANEAIMGSGAAAAAGVLNAIDEDGEGDEEATVPEPFDYFEDPSEGEDE